LKILQYHIYEFFNCVHGARFAIRLLEGKVLMSELRNFVREISNLNFEDDNSFYSIIQKSDFVLGLSDTDLAREIRISRPTISRWRAGKNAPHVLMREGVINFLSKRARAQLKKLEAYEARTTGGSSSFPTVSKVAARSR